MRANEDGALLPEYMACFVRSPRNGIARWHKKAEENKKRTSALLDWDIGVTLPRQWAMLQPDARRGEGYGIDAAAGASLSWPANTVCPGQDGIRKFVVTLLSWGFALGKVDGEEVGEEAAEWTRTAVDVAEVLQIVAAQHGPGDSEPDDTAPGEKPAGRKK